MSGGLVLTKKPRLIPVVPCQIGRELIIVVPEQAARGDEMALLELARYARHRRVRRRLQPGRCSGKAAAVPR